VRTWSQGRVSIAAVLSCRPIASRPHIGQSADSALFLARLRGSVASLVREYHQRLSRLSLASGRRSISTALTIAGRGLERGRKRAMASYSFRGIRGDGSRRTGSPMKSTMGRFLRACVSATVVTIHHVSIRNISGWERRLKTTGTRYSKAVTMIGVAKAIPALN